MFLTSNMLRTMLAWKARNSQIDQWAEQVKLFFILAIGRSGTTFLAALLDQLPATAVAHEPVKEDFRAHRQAFRNPTKADWYIHAFRKKEIFLRWRDQPKTWVYGEVNSVLRRHVRPLQNAFPQATFLHLVRDGRDVVRSMMSRRTMQPDDPHTRGIAPQPGDPYFEEWEKMDRFARLCWYWQVENAFLRQYLGPAIQFEKLIQEYDYFEERLLRPCGLSLAPEIWQTQVQQPKNPTETHQLPAWTEWEPSYQQTFARICGEEMRELGYEC